MWRALLDGDDREAAWSAVDDIRRSLADRLLSDETGGERWSNLTLAGGIVGPAILFAYLEAARPGSGADDHALDVLDRVIDGLATQRLQSPLYSGFTGVAWVIEHLTREFFAGDDDLTNAVDEALYGILADPGSPQPFELMRGLAGFGIYLLERLPHPHASELLGRLLDHLELSAEISGVGCTWHTRPEWIPPWKVDEVLDGCYDLGLAHGIVGVLGFLAAAQRTGIADPRVRSLAEGTVRWLLAHRLPEGGDTAFPGFLLPGTKPKATRTAWCYGDLGTAAVLLSAARSFGRPDWEREALDLARLAACRSEKAAGVVDASLCHGSAGNAHLFLRMHQATGDPALREAALEGFRRTLERWKPGEDMGGFSAWMLERGDQPGQWRAEAGFLMGGAGVALALLAAASDIEPDWDRVMVVSIPPQAAAATEAGS